MVKHINLLSLIFLITLITACNENKLSQSDKLIGTWTRIGDNYSRMKVTVEKNNNNVFGKIIFLPTLAQKNGFVFNDIKWKEIRKINNNKYSFSDLDVTINTFGDRVKAKYNLEYLQTQIVRQKKDKIKLQAFNFILEFKKTMFLFKLT